MEDLKISKPLDFSNEENISRFSLFAYRVKNYKAFHDTGWIELLPLTVFFGNNSSGKSAVHQPLLMLKNAWLRETTQNLATSITELDDSMPVFADLLNKKHSDEKLELFFRFIDDNGKYCDYVLSFFEDENGIHEDGEVRYGETCILNEFYVFRNVFFTVKNSAVIPGPVQSVVGGIMNELRHFANKLFYIRPHRNEPKRHFVFNGSNMFLAGEYGETAYATLFSQISDERINNEFLLDWLNEFGFDLKWRPSGINSGSFMLSDRKSGLETNLFDNGYGIGQSLPLIIQMSLLENSTLLIDSPVAFLQTNKQGIMADYLLRCIENNNNLIVETGSEYLLYRLRRRIAEKKIDVKNIVLYFIDSEEPSEEKCSKINLLPDGGISHDNDRFNEFFSGSFEDLRAIMNGSN